MRLYEGTCNVNLFVEGNSRNAGNCTVRLEYNGSGACVLFVDAGCDPLEITCTDIRQFAVPKSTSSRMIALDFTGHHKYNTVMLRFTTNAAMKELANQLQPFTEKSTPQLVSNPQATPQG